MEEIDERARVARTTNRALLSAWGVLVVVVFALLFRPVVRLGTHTFGPFDLTTQSMSLTRVDGDHVVSNRLLSDPATQMHPWTVFGVGEVLVGRAPLWNPFNGCGAPLFANDQSALLSPFALPYYALPFKFAVLAAALAKLLALATFAWLFFERIGCTRGAALFGAATLSASGVSLLLLQHPHSGVFACLPAAMYFTDGLVRSETRRRAWLASAGLAMSLGAAALAGHPETLLYVALLVALFGAFRAVEAFRARTTRDLRAPSLPGVLGLFGGACVVAVLLSAVQLWPFFDYLGRSAAIGIERDSGTGLGRANWPLFMFPNLAGTPMENTFGRLDLPQPNYQEFTTFFVGGTAFLCALFALPRVRVDGAARFFVALVLLWIVYAFDLGGVARWLADNTPLKSVPVHRSHPLWTMSVCALAAIGASALERGARPRGVSKAAWMCGIGAGLFAVFHWGADGYLDVLAAEVDTPRAELPETIAKHRMWIASSFALALSGCVVLATTARTFLRRAGHAALIAASVSTGAVSLADYVPTVEDRFVFPRTVAMGELQSLVGDERVVFLSVDGFTPELNVHYGVHLVGSYDAIGNADMVRLSKHFFGNDLALASPRRATRRGLELFGIRAVATSGDWVPIGTDLGDSVVSRFESSEFIADQFIGTDPPLFQRQRGPKMRFELTASRARFDGFAAQFVGPREGDAAVVHYALADLESGVEVVRGSRVFTELPRTPDVATELSVRFDEQSASAGRRYVLEFELSGVDESALPRIARRRWAERDSDDGGSREPKPKIDLAYGQSDFELLGSAGRLRLHRFQPSPGRAWLVGSARFADSHEQAFEWTTHSEFEPLREVVLEGQGSSVSSGDGRLELERVSENATEQRFVSDCDDEAWLVLAQTYDPGWRANVAGREVPVQRANYGFSAVKVPAGRHTIELEYRPTSFLFGLWTSLAGTGCVLLFVVFGARARGRERRLG